MVEKWFKPSGHTGWAKELAPSTRRSKLLSATDRRKNLDARYLEAGRKAQALANVTKDRRTKQVAALDARYFFSKLKK